MKKIYSLLTVFLTILVLIASGCMGINDYETSQSSDRASNIAYEEEAAYYPVDGVSEEADYGGAGTGSANRKTITTVEMSIEVDDAAATIDTITDATIASGGYVSSSSVYDLNYNSDTRKAGYITVRVPESDYPVFLETVEGLGDVQSKSVSGQDVTEEYIDVSARLENLRNQEVRLNEILNMSTTVEEVLSVEKELERVRGDIESLTGRLEYLDNRIEFTTINIRVTEPSPINQSWGLRDALSESVQGFISMVNALIVLAGYLLPIVILLTLLGGLVIGIRRMAKR
ncbi:DUF4349 domain-containing protein [Methanolobus zinderi]|uniref:DUF4349 domain-containing protein n=1 Tax=Methanolobus zinderi TaxID=536044 RepID=A0A7D5E9V3_9EURY|nr:DUF4349 domain-containing protein [Methanolobus zinderi]QLC50737.1 DUF4349 domain-containing protein [Methanolobus zinderi]